jgi:hypothetical protein
MSSNEKLITPYIDDQFPAVYREEAPQMVEFARMYYSWLQQPDEAVGRAKRLAEYRDIDETLDDFLKYFKDKYLPLFEFSPATEKRLLIKHVIDLYRAKGTERGTDLFFRLMYGTPAEVYYPGNDLFRLSDNKWVKRNYLELTDTPYNANFAGKKVTGKTSGATAFAEKYIVKKTEKSYAYVLFISNIEGNFQTGEQVVYDGIPTADPPIVIGSLSGLLVTSGGQSFDIGDIVDVESAAGAGAKARVAATTNTTGVVAFTLNDGGWGYTANSKVYISEKVLTLDNIVPDATLNNLDVARYANSDFFILERVYQPLANLDYRSGTATPTAGANLTSYYANGNVISVVRVLTVEETNSTSGNLFVSLLTGNSQINTHFYTAANASTINVQTYTDMTAYGNVVGSSANLIMYVSNATIQFSANQFVYQTDSHGRVSALAKIRIAQWGGPAGIIYTSNSVGAFNPSANIQLRYANGTNASQNAYLDRVTGSVGLANIHNTFTTEQGAWLYSGSSNTVANCDAISAGTLATFSIANTFSHSDTYFLNTDFVRDYLAVNVNAASYGFPGMPTANGNTIIDAALSTFSGTVGTITGLIGVNPGKDYTVPPFVFVYDPYIAGYGLRDYILSITPISSNFVVGEEVTQGNGAKGLIKAANTTALLVRRLTLLVDFSRTYSNTVILGSSSGANATLTYVQPDLLTLPVGRDADIMANVQIANGVVSSLDLQSTGFGFVNGEEATFTSQDGLITGTARVVLEKQGVTDGTFADQASFLSADKYLFDGYYWQTMSYDIRSKVTANKYQDNYQQTMHLVGTKMFSTFVHTSYNAVDIDIFLPEGTANTSS